MAILSISSIINNSKNKFISSINSISKKPLSEAQEQLVIKNGKKFAIGMAICISVAVIAKIVNAINLQNQREINHFHNRWNVTHDICNKLKGSYSSEVGVFAKCSKVSMLNDLPSKTEMQTWPYPWNLISTFRNPRIREITVNERFEQGLAGCNIIPFTTKELSAEDVNPNDTSIALLGSSDDSTHYGKEFTTKFHSYQNPFGMDKE